MDDFFETHDQDDLADFSDREAWEDQDTFEDADFDGDYGDEDAGMEAGLFGDC